MDLGYCSVLEHDIDTGDAEPIRQPPRRPPLSARQAEEDILRDVANRSDRTFELTLVFTGMYGQEEGWQLPIPVSYTHLTLPTNREV